MNVRFLKYYQGQGKHYEAHKMYPAQSVKDDGTGLVDIVFEDKSILLGVRQQDIEIYDGTITKAKPARRGCCNNV